MLLLKLKALVGRWGGLLLVVAGLGLWGAFPHLLQLVGAGTEADGGGLMDLTVFQTLLLSGIRAVALYCFALVLVWVYLPVVHRFWRRHFVRVFYRLSEWQQVIVSFWAVSLFVYICVSLTR